MGEPVAADQRSPDADDSVEAALIVDRVAPFAGGGQVGEELVAVGDAVVGVPLEDHALGHGTGEVAGGVGQHRLAHGRRVEADATALFVVEAEALSRRRDEHDDELVALPCPERRRFAGRLGQPFEHGPGRLEPEL